MKNAVWIGIAVVGIAISNGAELAHPHLLFTSGDLPAIRARIAAGGVPGTACERLRNRCAALLKTGNFPKRKYFPLDANGFDPLTELLFAWHFTGDTVYRDGFLKHYRRLRSEGFDLGNYDAPLLYDLGYELLTPEERTELRTRVRKCAEPRFVVEDWCYYSNWSLCRDSVPIFAEMALWGAPDFQAERIRLYAAQIRVLFRAFIGEEGIPEEGWLYWDYGLNVRGAFTIEALRRKGFDLTTGTRLDRVPAAMLATSVPAAGGGLRMLPFGDALQADNSVFGVNLLARLLPDHPLIPFLLRDVRRDDTHNYGVGGGILLYPEKAVPADPAAPLPDRITEPNFFESSKLLVFRDRPGADAFFLALQAKGGGGHAHEDAGAPILLADGVSYLIDPGYGKYDSGGHNSLLIDGDGTGDRGGGAGIVRGYLTSPKIGFVDLDLAACRNEKGGNWRCPAESPVIFHRRAVVALGDDTDSGVPTYAMVFDRARKDGAVHEFRQVWQTTPKKEGFQNGDPVKPEIADTRVRLIPEGMQGKELQLIPLGPENVKPEIFQHRDFGRFPKSLQRIDFVARAADAAFATLLLPLKSPQEPPKIVRLDAFNLRVRLDWAKVSDWWGWGDPEWLLDNNTASFLLLRTRRGAPPVLKSLSSYAAFDAGNVNLAMGREPLVRRFDSVSMGRSLYEDVGPHANLFWNGKVLTAQVFTPVNSRWQIRRRADYQVYAPAAAEVIVNGRRTAFRQDGDYVRFRAESTTPGLIDEARRERHQQLYDEFSHEWDRENGK